MWRTRIEQAVIVGTGLVVVAAALLLGGVHPEVSWGLSVAALSVFVAAVLLRLYKRGSTTVGAPFWVLGGIAVLAALQLVSLSPATLAWLQPKGAALVHYATGPLGGPVRSCLSLDPPGTGLALAVAIGMAALAGAGALLVRDGSRALLLLWTLDVGGMSLGLIALVQMLLGAEAVFWVYAPEAGKGFVAPFVNPNHAGAFYAALLFLHLGLSTAVRDPRARWVGFGLAALPAFLVLSSASRGAIAAAVLGGIVFLALKWREGAIGPRRFGYALAITLILGTVALPSSSVIRREFGRGTRWEAIDEEAKLRVWQDAAAAARDFPVTGVGRGAFRAAFAPYKRKVVGADERTFTHPENILVQYLVEFGPFLGAALLLLVLGLAIRWFRRTTLGPVHVAAVLPVLVLYGQNLVDFNLEFPGTAFLAAALLGVLAGLGRGRTRRLAPRRRRLLGGLALLFAAGLGAVGLGGWGRWGATHDLQREGAVLAARLERDAPAKAILRDAEQAIRRHPVDYYLQYLAGMAALRIPGERPLRFFNRALVLNPRSGRTQHQVGRALMALELHEQALTHLLAALELRVPLAGAFGRDLFRLLQILWRQRTAAGRGVAEGACRAALAGAPRLPAVDCTLVAAQVSEHASEPLAALARIDPGAGFTLARWLERSGLHQIARATYGRLRAAYPEDDEPLDALVRLSRKLGDPGQALYWARQWLRLSQTPESYEQVGLLLRQGGRLAEAEQVVSAGRVRHPRAVPLVALQAELLLARGATADARQVLLGRMLGEQLEIRDEIRLLSLRIEVERRAGNRLRVERLRSRKRQLESLIHAGYKGLAPRR